VSIEKMTDSTPLRIKRIEVEGLFGLYHHVIDLNLEDRVTILHGPNGVGKTVILKMLRAVIQYNFTNYSSIQNYMGSSGKFSLEFSDGRSIMLSKDSTRYDSSLENDIKSISLYFIEEQRTVDCISALSVAISPTGSSSSSKEKPIMVSRLDEYSSRLHSKLENIMATYGRESQNLDRTLPQRLFNKTTSQILNPEQLKQQLIDLENRYSELRGIGLLRETVTTAFDVEQLNNIDETKRGMMTLYIEDTQQKLSVLNDFAQRIKLFLNIINHKFKHKQIKIDHEKGFVIEGHDQQELRLSSLSSGEHHEIILAYDLLFETVPNSLVLIDEPELSLHPSWQKRFLPDLLEIVKIANFDVIIATHSPYIVGTRDDLMVALEAKL
jgi:predicted ATP-binding protein involved in virulence